MSRKSARVRASLLCVAVMLSAGCAGAPGAANPDAGPDLYEALPAPSPPPTAVPTTAPPVTTAPPTTKPAAAKAAARGSSSSGGSGVDWRPVNGDEFNGSSLDTKAWNTYDSEGAFGTGLRRTEAVSQSDGLLRITARDDVSGGMGHRYGQLYGRWEFRARTEKGRGFGSAILLWPDSENFPEDGELDIMEVPGENRDIAHFVMHWSAENKQHGGKVHGDFSQWHTFAIEWLPNRVTWYVDGVKQYENTNREAIPTKPMHLTIQLDQGPRKNWIAARDDTTPEELSLEVDWVRIYAMP